jgi:LDH2 family malate/lactate/ureidoglycolate dehydrogenase
MLERFKVPVKDQVFVAEAALRKTVAEIFAKMGLTPEDAAEGADVLTTTDLRGVETHGVSNMLRQYVRDYKAGKLDPRPGWKMMREAPGTAVIDAERRLGIIVGPKAMRLAMDKARRVGVGIVTVYNAGHFGAIGHYAMQAAEADMVGACFTAAGLHVVPTFAAKPLLGTNPIAIAAPARREAPLLFDAATSAIAGNKIRLAMRVGSPLLPGWVTDKEGTPIMEEKPVFDRDDFFQAPLGGTREQGSHKGYGLALMAEVLSTMLSGTVPTMLSPASGSKNQFAAYHIEAFTDLERFKDTMDETLRTLRTAPPAPGEERVRTPAWSRRRRRRSAAPTGSRCTARSSSGSASARRSLVWRPSLPSPLRGEGRVRGSS